MRYLGIVLKGDLLELSLIQKSSREEFIIVSLEQLPCDDFGVQQLYKAISEKQTRLVSGIATKDLLYRSVECTVPKNQRLEEILPFQIEDLLPYSAEEAIVAPMKKRGKGVPFFSTTRNLLKKHLSSLEKLSLDPDLVSCDPQALYRFFSTFFPERESGVVIHWGEENTTCLLVENRELILVQSIPAGNQILEKSLALDLPTLSKEERERESAADRAFLPHFATAIEKCSSQLTKLYQFLLSKNGHLDSPVFLGDHARFSEIAVELERIFGAALEPPPSRGIAFSILEKHAVSLGLAIDASKENNRVQFRDGPFLSIRERGRWRKTVVSYCSICALSLLPLFFLGNFLLSQKRSAILSSIEKIVPPNQSLEGGIETILYQLRQDTATPLPYAALPVDLPSPEQLLSWLDSTPSLIGKAIVEEIRYLADPYPKLGEKTISSKAKASLIVRIESVTELEKALKENSSPANTKEKIVVTNLDANLYQIDFALKNVTGGAK